MALEQNPDWQLIQFMIAPDGDRSTRSTTRTRQVNEYIEQIQYGDEADARRRRPRS